VLKAKRSSNARFSGVQLGHRSGLEDTLAAQLKAAGVPSEYESCTISYYSGPHTYTPDFPLPNGIIVESKGYFKPEDRAKHLLIKQQHPNLDIRFVFQRGATYIASKKEREKREANARRQGKPLPKHATYIDWCRKNGFQCAEKLIPQAWIDESWMAERFTNLTFKNS
jgi:Autographiviridae endonuclease I